MTKQRNGSVIIPIFGMNCCQGSLDLRYYRAVLASPDPLLAWADESHAIMIPDRNIYLFGAVVLPESDVENARAVAATLLRSSEQKAHWRKRTNQRRDEMISVLNELPITPVVAIRFSSTSEREERQRRKCLEQFIPLLVNFGVSDLILESRGSREDKLDRDMFSAMQSQGQIPGSEIRLDHMTGPGDPLLWLADALCGAALADRRGESRWWRGLTRDAIVMETNA